MSEKAEDSQPPTSGGSHEASGSQPPTSDRDSSTVADAVPSGVNPEENEVASDESTGAETGSAEEGETASPQAAPTASDDAPPVSWAPDDLSGQGADDSPEEGEVKSDPQEAPAPSGEETSELESKETEAEATAESTTSEPESKTTDSDESAESEAPAQSAEEPSHSSSTEDEPEPGGSVANPIRAMRVIKLEEHSKRSGSAPAIETSDASFEDLEDELSEDEMNALAPSPEVGSVEPVSKVEAEAKPTEAESTEEVEELESVEEVSAPKPSAAPAPPRRDSQPVIPAAKRKPPPPRRSARPSLPKAEKPRKKPWWETLFGDDFSRAYRPMTQSQLSKEVDFMLESLEIPRGSVILDLGCGQGEICVELSRRGYSVVGYDLSVYQLAMAGDNAQQAKQKINFLQGDMREMAFDEMFDAVICWDTSFGYFEDEKNLEVLHRVKKALKPNGRFLLDVMNRDFAAREAPYNHWFEGDGCVCMDDMSLDWITNRLKVKRSIILDDGRSKELQYATRLYTLSEVGRMLHDVGFRVSAVSGDVVTKGAFFGPHSRRVIIQAGKP